MWIYDNALTVQVQVQCSVSGSDRFDLLYFTLLSFTLLSYNSLSTEWIKGWIAAYINFLIDAFSFHGNLPYTLLKKVEQKERKNKNKIQNNHHRKKLSRAQLIVTH